MSQPSHTLDELKTLTNTFEGGNIDRWYQAEDNPIFHVGLGEYGERFHIAYANDTDYLVEVGKVYDSGLGWDDITERVLQNMKHDGFELEGC